MLAAADRAEALLPQNNPVPNPARPRDLVGLEIRIVLQSRGSGTIGSIGVYGDVRAQLE